MKHIVCLALVSVVLALSACASKKVYYSSSTSGLTVAEIRQLYIHRLQSDGVQVIQLGETMRFVLLSDDMFHPDSANVVSDYRPVLRTLAKLMKTYDKVNVKVAAYTDNRGAVNRQQALTTRQAQVIASFLWSRGIDARLVYAMGYNRRNPVDENQSAIGRQSNRRVEISFRFYPKQTYL